MKKLAIIPARGGSKRIPRKNIRSFLGKPIIAYSIEAALQSSLFDEVMVSTEDAEIADIATQYGAKVPFRRSNQTAGDYATTVEVLLEVLQAYSDRGEDFVQACCIYPTAPFVQAELLDRAYQLLYKGAYDSVFPVLRFSFPIQRALKINAAQRMELFQPKHLSTRSQDLEPAYHDAGQFYWFDVEKIKLQKKLWTDNTGVLVLSELEAHDIDQEEDWKIAELKYQLQRHG